MNESFPRVLVISKTRIGTETATGSAMRNLFWGWPGDRIAQIHTDYASAYDYSLCTQYHMLDSPFRRIIRKSRHGRRILNRASGINWLYRPGNYTGMLEWCRTFRPDVIYYRVIERPAFYLWVPQKLAHQLNVPLVTHIMDDWPSRCAGISSDDEQQRKPSHIDLKLKRLFQKAKVNLSICEKMSRGFGERYGTKFIPFHNSIDHEEWQGIKRRRSYETDGRFLAVYTGSMANDMTLISLRDMARVITRMNRRGLPITMDIYGSNRYQVIYNRRLRRYRATRFCGFVPREMYLQILADADLLLLPVNFDNRSLTYIRYSMANKGPDYMASGSPILAYGPMGAATIEYASQNKWAYTVCEKSDELLEAAIHKLIQQPELRRQLGEKARAFGRDHHHSDINRKRFRQTLRSACHPPAPVPSSPQAPSMVACLD